MAGKNGNWKVIKTFEQMGTPPVAPAIPTSRKDRSSGHFVECELGRAKSRSRKPNRRLMQSCRKETVVFTVRIAVEERSDWAWEKVLEESSSWQTTAQRAKSALSLCS